ncbi:TPA: hypothetical protein IAB95_03655 [Candidatus Ventrenecus avicola]|nr:hypothetical protein [Candidatus Ventrenecus avicola]
MKKKHLCDITKTIILLVFSFLLVINQANAKALSIEKTETSDSYYYSVKDSERDLEYSWRFIKEQGQNISVEDSLYIEEDLRLSLDAKTKDTEAINQMVDQEKLIISFDYHGALPLETSVKINVQDRFQEGEKLYLYYYNPESDNIEYIAHNVEVKDGYVEFQIAHCSDYFLTAAVVNDAVNNPQSINYIIIGLIVIVFILVAITLFQSKNK